MAIVTERTRRREEEGESVFVSMTDLSVSFLFILLILLAFFATQIHPENTVPREELEKALARIEALKLQVADLEKQVEELLLENHLLREILAAKDMELKQLRAALNEQSDRIAFLRDAISKKDARIDALEEEVRTLELRVAELEAEVDRLNRRRLDPLATYLQLATLQRRKFLEDMKKRIESTAGIKVTVFSEEGLIRLAADEFFESARWQVKREINPEAHRIAVAIAHAFKEVLPPYTLGPQSRFDPDQNGAFALIETVQIEGHTDADPIRSGGILIDNLDLSSRRAADMFRAIRDEEPGLLQFLNLRDVPVLSFSGYGALRPLKIPSELSSEEVKRRNRRIDLRFILQSPQSEREIERIRQALRQSGAEVAPDE
ncbi:MAG: hypothetical protein P1U65_10570 [Minwuia sp.]|nr:hypothetical protein [Minwuia sp.]